MKKRLFGKTPEGEEIYIFELKDGDSTAEIINYGARIASWRPIYERDILGGYDTLEDYIKDESYQGATIGRVANRIENAEFTLDGAIYMLTENNHGNCLHGGVGFRKRVFTPEAYDGKSVTMSYYSPDGEDGFPAGLLTKVTFTVSGTALIIKYEATPDGKTPIALTNHSFFNLDGFGGDIMNHLATIYADRYTAVDERLIPTGERPLVEGTVFDLRAPQRIGISPTGFDHNFILCPKVSKEFEEINVPLIATVENADMRLNTYTDQPGVQFYTGNFLGGDHNFRGGVRKVKHGAFCLEAQTEPNCIKHGEAIYDAGEIYRQITVYEAEAK